LRRVAVTGLGVVSPLGNDPGAFFDNLVAGRSGVCRLEGRSLERLATRVGAPARFDAASVFAAPRLRMLDRVSSSRFTPRARRSRPRAVRSTAPTGGAPASSWEPGWADPETTDDGYAPSTPRTPIASSPSAC
jgi:3-oxoacyl-[acyl-carrier-protein] synthase II